MKHRKMFRLVFRLIKREHIERK